jgi:phosphotransferase system IIB component
MAEMTPKQLRAKADAALNITDSDPDQDKRLKFYLGIGPRPNTNLLFRGGKEKMAQEQAKSIIESLGLNPDQYGGLNPNDSGQPFWNLAQAVSDTRQKADDLEEQRLVRLESGLSKEATYNTLAEQIAALGGRQPTGTTAGVSGPAFNDALAALGGQRNYGTSDLASRLNFQVSDQDILNDINNAKISRLNNVVNSGNAQIAGINERLNAAQTLLDQLPAGDPRRTSSEVYVNQLRSDLKSVTEAVAEAGDQIKNYKPVTADSEEGLREIVSFREYIQLPEERAANQLRQIDPESYRTAVGLGQRYRQMATQPLGPTTTPQTEQLRQQIEQEAINQLQLGATLGAEERRGYEQAVRAAQTARGNIFGLGPAVQEAAQIGAAGEQRKLARYGAAMQFLGSGETTGAAQARDLALRDALTQQRLGAAAGFIAGGPSIANLAQARTQQQQQAMQNYVASAMGAPGGFNMAPSTAQNFYQTVSPEIPVALTAEFNKLYGSQAQYQASTYGAQTQAIASSYTSPSRAFANIAGGLSGLVPSFSFSR